MSDATTGGDGVGELGATTSATKATILDDPAAMLRADPSRMLDAVSGTWGGSITQRTARMPDEGASSDAVPLTVTVPE